MANEILKMIRIARKQPEQPFYKSFTPLSILPHGDWAWAIEQQKCEFIFALVEEKDAPWRVIKKAFRKSKCAFYPCHVAKAKQIVKKYKSREPYGLADMLI